MKSPRGRQLVLDLPHRSALGRDDFLVSRSNAEAVAFIDRWPSWPTTALALVGHAGSGKTHLAEVWRRMSEAKIIAAQALARSDIPPLLAEGALVIEDAAVTDLDERALFHLLNLAREQNAFILLTAQEPPATWRLKLPDLASRLKAIPMIRLGLPDDDLLRGVIVKLFADRQISVDEAVVSYILTRIPRALAAARALLAEIDRRALEEKAEVTRNFVARVLRELDQGSLFSDDEI
jgi:chromosomal replication initiation ATPase DnaA